MIEMSVAPQVPDPASARRPRLALVPRPAYPRRDLPPLRDELDWWTAAPLRDGHRALRELPGDALERLIEHYLPFVQRSLRPHRDFLAAYLGDSDDVNAQAAEWLLDAMRGYDPARGVPFAGYVASRLPRWVADAARGRWAERLVADSETAYARAVEQSLRERHRVPTLVELAQEFDEDVTATARRLCAVAVRRGLRRPVGIDGLDVDALPVRSDGALWAYLPAGEDGGEVDARLLALEDRHAITAALIHAAAGSGGSDGNACGLWTLLLEQLGGFPRNDLEQVGRRGRRAIVAAQARLVADVHRRLAAS